MKQTSNSRRSRGRGGNGKRSSNRNNNYDNGGPEGRIRGNANQIHEKYMALARDALAADDRISSENYFQHAEHFYRIMMANAEGKKDSSNSNNADHNSETNKERNKLRRSRSNNRSNNRNNPQKNEVISEDGAEIIGQQNDQLEKNQPKSSKNVNKLNIETPENNQDTTNNNKDDNPDETLSA